MQPSVDQVWQWLDQVPDPEIPVISVTELGIVRDINWAGDTLEIAVTPTYSGCPATSVISMDIETAMRDRGIENPDLDGTWRKLTPLRQLGDPVDIADAVCFLASREARFINGQTLYVDGGLWSQVPWPFIGP